MKLCKTQEEGLILLLVGESSMLHLASLASSSCWIISTNNVFEAMLKCKHKICINILYSGWARGRWKHCTPREDSLGKAELERDHESVLGALSRIQPSLREANRGFNLEIFIFIQ